ncbi:MAG TPA: ATP-binding protein [bacterium]|nr:ATP-binding protein [bacterium]HQG44298.1 ATP-binding protein [bacterium]HQI47746.1 ATP-binding protein [bacterium]HQJ63871.1 ATP-binding protein [bacterium]
MGIKRRVARLYFTLKQLGPRWLPGRCVRITITSDPVFLRILRAAIDEIAVLAGFTRKEGAKIILAVDEACSNVIRHAYHNIGGQPIYVTCRITPIKLEIVIIDLGEPADIKSIKPRPLDELRPGGLGVHIIRTVMDEVHYENLSRIGNRLIMAKFLPREERAS